MTPLAWGARRPAALRLPPPGDRHLALRRGRRTPAGYEEAFGDLLPSGARVVYRDATRDLPGMIEPVERTPAQEEVYAAIHRAPVGWDGSDPMRRTDG